MGGGNNNEPQTTTTETNPWAPTQGAGKDIINMAGDLFEQSGGINGNWIDFNAPGMNDYLSGAYDKLGQNQALGNISNQLGGLAGGLSGALGGALSNLEKASKGYSTYDVQNLRDTFLGDKSAFLEDQNAAIMSGLKDQQAQAVGGIYGAAAGGGNVGSSRTQLATGEATGALSSQAQATMAGLQSQAYDQSMAAATGQLQAQQQAQFQAAQQGFGAAQMGANIYGQQAGIENQMNQNMLQAGLGQYNFDMMQAQMQYQNLMGQQNAGWKNLGLYNQMVGSWAGAGGTSTATGPAPQQGGGFMNSLIGAGATIGAAWLSDPRLKQNAFVTGVDEKTGLTIYEWEWNEEAMKLPEELRNYNVGFMADEVQAKYPEFVTVGDHGYLMVDYVGLAA